MLAIAAITTDNTVLPIFLARPYIYRLSPQQGREFLRFSNNYKVLFLFNDDRSNLD